MSEIIFYLISISMCIFALLTVSSRNIFHSAVWLSLTLLSVAGIYFYLGSEFLGVIQVLVYIGGIITLFVFAIKLTAYIEDESIVQTNRQVFAAAVVSLTIFFILLKSIVSYPSVKADPGNELTSLKQIGEALLTTYMLPFEFLSLLLLAAMVGAIVIGKVKK